MKKNNINPFKIIKGKHIPLHQSKEGSTKIETPVENKPFVLDEKTREKFGFLKQSNKNSLEEQIRYERGLYTDEDLDNNIKELTGKDDLLVEWYKLIKNPNRQNVNKTSTEITPIENNSTPVIQKEITPKVDLKTEYKKATEESNVNGESDEEDDIKNKLNQKEISEEKELETKITKQLENPVTSKWGIDNIPQIKSNNFNEAFNQARSIHKNTGGIGMFEWNGQIYGSALNTKEELAKYDNLFANTDYGKQFNKASNIYTGSGIAGETFAQRQAYLDYQRKIQEDVDRGINPTNPKSKGFRDYEDYLEQWNIAKKRGASNDELNAITQLARNQDLTTGKSIETPKKTSNSGNFFDIWRELGDYVKTPKKKERDWTSFAVDASLKGAGTVVGGYFGRGRIGAGLGTAVGGATADFINSSLGYEDRENISGVSTVLDDFVEGAILDPLVTKRILPLLKPIGKGLYNYGSSFFKSTGKGIQKVSSKIANELLTESEIKNLKNLNPFSKDNYTFNVNVKSAFNNPDNKGALKHFNKGNKYHLPEKEIPDFPDIVPIPKVKPVIPNSNYKYSNNPIVNKNPIIATANYKKPLYNTGNIPTLPSQPVILKPAYNNPNIRQPKLTSGDKVQSDSKATPISKSSQGTKYKPEDEDLKFLLKHAVGNHYIKRGNKIFRKINEDWFEIKAQGGKLNPFKYADGGGINPFLLKNPYDKSNGLTTYTNDEFEIGQTMDNEGISFNSNSQNKNIINPYDQLYRNTDIDYNGSINPYMNRNRQDISLPEVPLRKPEDEVVDDISNQPKKYFGRKIWDKTKQAGNYIGKQTKGLDAFDVINAGNMIKGYMGRNIKPPKRSWEDRQDIIAPAQGMNQFQKQSAMNDLQQQANLSNYNNRTIDPRMNNVSMLGIQQNTNQGLNQLNSQDSQMYQTDQQRMMGQKQQENLRMLQGKQNFDQRIQDENMRNYQMQQQASQQSINQGLNYMQMKQADNRKRAMQEKTNNQMLNAQMYQNSITEMQQRVKVNLADNSVTNFDGTVTNFNTPQEAIAYADKLRMSSELEQAGMQEALRRSKGFKTFMTTNWGQEEMKKGGILEISEIRKPQYNKINPFKISNYTSDLMRMATSFGLKNMQLRKDINNKTR